MFRISVGVTIDTLTLQGLEMNRWQKLSVLRLMSQNIVPTVYI